MTQLRPARPQTGGTGPAIVLAGNALHAAAIRDLFWDYLQWANPRVLEEYGVSFDIARMLEDDIAGLDQFAPPAGRLLLAFARESPAGIACLRRLDETTGEVKRMYVRPDCRRQGLGTALLERLLAEARQIGYARLRLDSARFMTQAHALYRAAGFHEIGPYEGSEIPKEFQTHWVFMQRDLP